MVFDTELIEQISECVSEFDHTLSGDGYLRPLLRAGYGLSDLEITKDKPKETKNLKRSRRPSRRLKRKSAEAWVPVRAKKRRATKRLEKNGGVGRRAPILTGDLEIDLRGEAKVNAPSFLRTVQVVGAVVVEQVGERVTDLDHALGRNDDLRPLAGTGECHGDLGGRETDTHTLS